MTSDTSAAISLIVTCWNPHSAVSSNISDDRSGVERFSLLTHRARFWRNMDSCRGAASSEPFHQKEENGAEGRVFERPDGFYWEAKEARSSAARSIRAPKPKPTCCPAARRRRLRRPERRCRKPNPSSASPSGSTPTPAARRRTTSPASKITEGPPRRSAGRTFQPYCCRPPRPPPPRPAWPSKFRRAVQEHPLRRLPAGTVVSVRIVTSGRLLVALVGMKQLK